MKRIDLHNHLDGSLPVHTVLELARMSGVALPADTVDGIRAYLTVEPDCTSLNEYLEKIRQSAKFKKWFFGHYHNNKNVNAQEILLYEQIMRIV